MIVEMHIIQNFAPSNLNRDDSNTPKDCEFGGYRRARISSQCIKRAVRRHEAFKKTIRKEKGDLGIRTKRIIGKVADLLEDNHEKNEEEALRVAERAVALFGIKRDDKRPDKTSILLYLGESELMDITRIAANNWNLLMATDVSIEREEPVEDAEIGDEGRRKKSKKTKLTKEQKEIQKELHGVVGEERLKSGSYAADVALFGRMVADKNVKNMNVDAACQVAHAISTNKVEMEMDYFTAVDDLLPNDEAGSDMIGVVEFNSSCFYRYSNINVVKLRENLGMNNDLLAAAVLGYLEASIKAVPTGKQNSMAAQNPAGYARVVIRKDGFPWSLANAFQKPVRAARGESLEELSIAELEKYFERLKAVYGSDAIVCDVYLNVNNSDPGPGPGVGSLKALLEAVGDCLAKEATA